MKLVVYLTFFLYFQSTLSEKSHAISKRALQKSHEKSHIQKLSEMFLNQEFYNDKQSLIELLNFIAYNYLSGCTTVILYDKYTEIQEYAFLKHFLTGYPLTYVNAQISTNNETYLNKLINNRQTCVHFMVFVRDVVECRSVVEKRPERIVVVAESSQWRVQEFLASDYSQNIVNLLVIARSDKFSHLKGEAPFILYSHRLFIDALGSSQPIILTSWSGGNFSRYVNLFERKMSKGFSGHRFIISVANQPPYIIKKKRNEYDEFQYDGIEVKLVELLSEMYNFSTDYKEASDTKILGSADAVMKSLKSGNINLGLAGLFITQDRYNNAGIFHWHSEDCAAFISLASTALPRYRAIMGPFRWTVWLCLIIVYFGAVFLFSYSDKMTLRHLIRNPEEIENMFWYVFGTFTNCFTFMGRKSWTKAEKNTTKLLVGVYWIFTIIITACYTGSIIAFVTLPVFPTVINTVDQLLNGRFQIGILDKSGWPNWFLNVTDVASQKLMKKVDYVPDTESGLKNVTKAFFWPYAYLASREELSYIVKSNFSVGSKKSLLHISQQCFVPYKVGMLLPKFSVYSEIFGHGVQQIIQSGIMIKIKNDIEWNILKSATGKLLAANTKGGGLKLLTYEDRALTLDDTQGMFLLLGAGFLVGFGILLSEIFGGCFNLCKKTSRSGLSSASTFISNYANPSSVQDQRDSSKKSVLRRCSLILTQKRLETKPTNLENSFGDVVNFSDNMSISNSARNIKSALEHERSIFERPFFEKRSKSYSDAI
ncbi:ionotropic receptor 21a [Sitophilus oryzae]|uniref:Ionotropic receptor 21a n=1 Tax=Sitophilus oryzae TaxID=7048 RepID=A0A6J2XBZ3_SITOR|nr:ionotropic receptor 21a [Sitophilus oryzae]